MARCLGSEKVGRPVFYGAMITEGIVALIWATVSIYFFYYGGWRQVVDANGINEFLAQTNGGKSLIQYFTAPNVVEKVCTGWLGFFGGVLAIFGVVVASYYKWRYSFPLCPPDHCRCFASQSERRAQALVGSYPDVRSGYCTARVADGEP